MHFLPDVWVTCESCGGARYTAETLAIKFRGRTIADVLEMKVDAALELFAGVPKIKRVLQTLHDVGLGYVALGQAAPTLSGGEAQRVKLATELSRPDTGRTLYVLDEPTTGLHMNDVKKLLAVVHRLADLGNTVVIIEHNLEVIKTADWILDVGPEAGAAGGLIVAEGPPETVAETEGSLTGAILADVLAASPQEERIAFDPKAAARAAIEEAKAARENQAFGIPVASPWEQNGRQWHTADRVTRTGKPVRWDGRILESIIDTLADDPGFAPPDWSSRTIVRVSGNGPFARPFFEASTGSEWVITLRFYVPRNTFRADDLDEWLALPPFEECSPPVRCDAPRVVIQKDSAGEQEVVITAHSASELETRAFEGFLEQAINAFATDGIVADCGIGDLEESFTQVETILAHNLLPKPRKPKRR
jgi:excinuclease ABC subunit A